MSSRRDRSAGVVVFRRCGDDHCFLLLRSRLTRRPLWEFAKGGIDAGETRLQAALRELAEETGLGSEDIRLVDGFEVSERYRFTLGSGEERIFVEKEVTYFLAETEIEEVRLSAHEASDFAWLPAKQALSRVRYPERRRILRAALRAIAQQSDR